MPQRERLDGSAAAGYWCNLKVIGGYPSTSQATFDAYENCAYYSDNKTVEVDSGTIVLDVSDPRHPKQTAYLRSRAMRNAGESLRVNQARGLLVADHYNPAPRGLPFSRTATGKPQGERINRALDVYDVSKDCAHPKLLADVILPSINGHEGCFQPDGKVYYVSGWEITPVDLTRPRRPKQLSEPWQPWQPSDPLPVGIHGCSISDDGRRGYFADLFNGQMLIVDTSEVQARKENAQMRVIGSFRTPRALVQSTRFSAPRELVQSTVPLSYGGDPYVLLFSEAMLPPKACLPGQPTSGFPRILDVGDEADPTEASRMQTEVVLAENCRRVAADSTFQTRGLKVGQPFLSAFNAGLSAAFGYDSHYCTPDRLRDPTIVACAQLGSGLRVYDIRNPFRPAEIAYYNTGTVGTADADFPALDWAQARPVIRRDRRQIWWVTWNEGFHVAKFRRGVWPFAGDRYCPRGYDYFQDQYDAGPSRCRARHRRVGRPRRPR